MAIVEAWASLLPTDSDALSDGDNKIRDYKRALRERMVNGGILWEPNGGATTDQDAGKLTCGVQGTTGILSLFENAAGVIICTVRDGTDAGGIKQLEIGDTIGGSEQYDLRSHSLTCRDFQTSGAGTVDLSSGDTILAANQTFINDNTGFGALTGGATFDTLMTSGSITTRPSTAGPMLIEWHGGFQLPGTAYDLDVRIVRQPGAGVVALFNSILFSGGTGNVGTFPVTIFFLDTGATADTATTYEIQAEEVNGSISESNVLSTLLVTELRNV